MLKLVASNRFKKDLKTAQKRGFDMSLLRTVINDLAEEKLLLPSTVIMSSPVSIKAFGSVMCSRTGC